MKKTKINEDVLITDPALAQQYANGKQQLVNKDSQINSLNKQVLKLQQDKIKIQQALDQIEKKSAEAASKAPQPAANQPQQQNQNTELINAQKALASQILMNSTSESAESMYKNYLSNRLVALEESVGINPEYDEDIMESINFIKSEISFLNENIDNPFSKESFYNISETYEDEDDNDTKYLLYVEIEDKDNKFMGKIFKRSPDSKWFGKIIYGSSRTFENMTYDERYEEDDILNFLISTYDNVKILSDEEFNNYREINIFYDQTILKDLKQKYPNAIITLNEVKPKLFFARVDINKQDGKKEYLGSIKGAVPFDDALNFIKNTLDKNYDSYY